METKAVEVDALVQSFNEPQLDRCLKSIREQTHPYHRIININGVVGTYNAFNRGVASVQTEWFSHVGGDCIFKKEGLESLLKFMSKYPHEKCIGYYYDLYDPFLEINCGYMGIARSSAYKDFVAPNDLTFDRAFIRKMRREGWFIRKNRTVMGTHFEDPDEYQVFHRFFVLSTKDGNGGYEINRNMVQKLYDKHQSRFYAVALRALEFGKLKGPYTRSIDDNYNREMYEEFKKWT